MPLLDRAIFVAIVLATTLVHVFIDSFVKHGLSPRKKPLLKPYLITVLAIDGALMLGALIVLWPWMVGNTSPNQIFALTLIGIAWGMIMLVPDAIRIILYARRGGPRRAP